MSARNFYIMQSAVGPMQSELPCYTPLTNHATDVHTVALVFASDYAALEAECARMRPLAEDRDQQYDMKVKAREQRDAALAECERLRELLREASSAMSAAHESLFDQCLSNGMTNAWGKPVDVSKINDLQPAARSIDAALSAKPQP